jgi:hypothetical protein
MLIISVRLGTYWESTESFHIFLKSTFTVVFYCCYTINKPTDGLYKNVHYSSKFCSRQAHHRHRQEAADFLTAYQRKMNPAPQSSLGNVILSNSFLQDAARK